MVTPRSKASTIGGSSGTRKRARNCEVELVELSASPRLGDNSNKMKRTPQPALTQSKLTSMIHTQPARKTSVPEGPGVAAGGNGLDQEKMDTSESGGGTNPTPNTVADPSPSPLVTTDILMRALKENTNFIIKSSTSNLGALSQRVDINTNLIARNTEAIRAREAVAIEQRGDIDSLAARVMNLERCRNGTPEDPPGHIQALLSQEYSLAHRSIRFWPVPGTNEEDLWGNVGDFIHGTLRVSVDEVG